MRHIRGELYRLRREGKIAGICAGLADYFGIETWLVRIIFVSGVLFSGPFLIFAYVALWFILDVKPGHEKGSTAKPKWDNSFEREQPTERDANAAAKANAYIRSKFAEKPTLVKETVWQAGEPPKQAFHDIASKFKGIEKRLQKLETYVTSKEFTVSREIDRL